MLSLHVQHKTDLQMAIQSRPFLAQRQLGLSYHSFMLQSMPITTTGFCAQETLGIQHAKACISIGWQIGKRGRDQACWAND